MPGSLVRAIIAPRSAPDQIHALAASKMEWIVCIFFILLAMVHYKPFSLYSSRLLQSFGQGKAPKQLCHREAQILQLEKLLEEKIEGVGGAYGLVA